MKRIIRTVSALVIGAATLMLANGGRALGQTTNYWNSTSSGYWTNANNWTPSSVPTSNHWPVFNSNASSAYTVTFTGIETNEPLNVVQDKVNFDLQGNTWRIIRGTGGVAGQEYTNIGTSGAPAQVTFTSTGGQGTATVVRTVGSQYFRVGAGSTLTITNARLDTTDMYFSGNGTINILGPGAELHNAGYEAYFGNMNILDGGLATLPSGAWGANLNSAQIVVANGGTLDARGASARGLHVGNTGYSTLSVLSNATVLASTITMGQNVGSGEVLVDDSEVYTRSLRIGGEPGTTGKVVLQNGAVLEVGTNWWGTHAIPFIIPADGTIEIAAKTSGPTNTLVINNATIKLGGGAMAGSLTNRGIMRAMGTITGLGSSPALVRNEKLLEVGGSIGTLTLNNANLELAAGSVTLWEFSDTGLDQINVVGGWAKLDGTNLFSLAAGSANPTPGVKWGLGVYDFVLGTGVTAGVNYYANMTNLLGGYLLTEGVDYRFGVVDLGGGLQALELAFVPEPSTVLLLVGGGLVLWRVRRRK